jgi:hypothetical protein
VIVTTPKTMKLEKSRLWESSLRAQLRLATKVAKTTEQMRFRMYMAITMPST